MSPHPWPPAAAGTLPRPGCGTGRALPLSLRQAVGPHGTVIAADLTPEMLRHARARSGTADAVRDIGRCPTAPFARVSADAVFTAGLVTHSPTPRPAADWDS